MLESPVRVALLARPGDARDQLRRALAELGAQLVAEGDPAELDPGTVAGEKPSVVLISLEPAIEDSLSRFDDLLAAPGIQVMYDDAEVTRQLDGWDLARWARHVAAKLVGSDLLPPPPGGADHLPEIDLSPEPGAPPTPAEEMAGEKLEDYAAESLALSEWVPSTPSLAQSPVATTDTTDTIDPQAGFEDASLDLDLGDLEQALGRVDAQVQTAPRQPDADDDLDFDPSNLDIDLSALPEEGAPLPSLNDSDELDSEAPLLIDVDLSGPVSFSSFNEEETSLSGAIDDDVAALAAQLDAFEAKDQRQTARQPDFATGQSLQPPRSPAAAPQEMPKKPALAASGFGSLTLLSMDEDVAAHPAAAASAATVPRPDLASLGAGLSLADLGEQMHSDAAPMTGALLVLAGLGGPDAVRQLLAALPSTLPVPVLLYQHLDTGKHDRLVGQLAKASRLPIELAEEGRLAFPARVAVLPPGLGVSYGDNNFRFIRVEQLSSVVASLPAAGSVVLVLSGADPSVVPALLDLRSAGALVLAQDPASCFDAVAARQVIQAGAVAARPGELAALVLERWK